MNLKTALAWTLSCAAWLSLLPVWASPTLPPINAEPTGLSLPGKFIWFDLAAPVPGESQEFYSSVFGWTFRSPGASDDRYTLILNDGQAIGGMFGSEPDSGAQDGATWIGLMAVNDVEATVRAVQNAGGVVEVNSASVPERGKHALLRDPAGAIFGVLASDSGDPPDREVSLGEFLWMDLFARDVAAVTPFYLALAPYERSTRTVIDDVERTVLTAHDYPRAGIVPVDEEANRSAWVPYIRVNDVESTLAKVVDAGGFAIIQPDARLLDGNLAVFVDPHGAVMGIVKWNYLGEPSE